MARATPRRITPKGPSKATLQPTPSTAKAARGGIPARTPSGGAKSAGKASRPSPPNSGKPV